MAGVGRSRAYIARKKGWAGEGGACWRGRRVAVGGGGGGGEGEGAGGGQSRPRPWHAPGPRAPPSRSRERVPHASLVLVVQDANDVEIV